MRSASYGGRGADAEPRSPGGGRRAVHLRARARRRDAAFSHVHPHRTASRPSMACATTAGFASRTGPRRSPRGSRRAGFATGAFVGGFPLTKRFGLTPGFDVYDDQMPELEGRSLLDARAPRPTTWLRRAVEWIGKTAGRFFSWVHVFDPHSPYKPPADLAATYAAQPYDGEVAFVDRALGPLFDRLATLPAANARRRHLGPRREPRRARRDDARDVRLRGHAARAAHRRQDRARDRAPREGSRHRHAGAPCRHRADGARLGWRRRRRTVRGDVIERRRGGRAS